MGSNEIAIYKNSIKSDTIGITNIIGNKIINSKDNISNKSISLKVDSVKLPIDINTSNSNMIKNEIIYGGSRIKSRYAKY